MPYRFLIDANLPPNINIWQGGNFLHVQEIGVDRPDEHIWQYAIENDYIIVTKDSDFEIRMRISSPPPKIILFKTGNMRFKEFNIFLKANWSAVVELLNENKLILVFNDSFQGIK